MKSDEQNNLNESEWLVTNGIGGFACGPIFGVPSRKYHSFLNAALPAPYGRTVMLNYISESLILPDQTEIPLSTLNIQGQPQVPYKAHTEFRLENGMPHWIYRYKDIIIQKNLFLIYGQNTLHLSYEILSPHENMSIRWTPFFHFRTNEQPLNVVVPNESYSVHAKEFEYEIECPDFPLLRLYNSSYSPFIMSPQIIENVYYEIEAKRGYEFLDTLKSPGYFLLFLKPKEKATFIASTEPWKTIYALSPEEALRTEKLRKKNLLKAAGPIGAHSNTAKLILAADQFLLTPITRSDDMIRLQALGEQVKTVIAGFPWFTDWGRDTMISLEGLTLCTGRSRDAYSILHTFAYYVKEGLIPNMFPDGEYKGIYNTADATLWFFHAIDRYIELTGDQDILEFLLPVLHKIINYHMKGTLYGIKMDKSDGLLIQGELGVQLTWMDAKVNDWVVTPRRGKAVEINALWYNALKLYEQWTNKSSELSDQCFDSFNNKFWIPEENYLYDVIEGEGGNDSALRPNQLLAISLKYPVLREDRWKPVLKAVQDQLLTPVGLRTLAPHHPDYQANYDGDLHSRDAAYHQGTVWPWLLGPYIDAWLKTYPEDVEHPRAILKGLEENLNSNCMDTIGEIFDASPPYKARGCFAQAWSVAEFLRCLIKVSPELHKKNH